MTASYPSKTYTSNYEIGRLEIIREAIGRIAGATGFAVEFGCNNGTITAILAEACHRVLAIDRDQRLLEEAQSQFPHRNVEWEQYDLNHDLPSDLHGRFDLAVALEVIEHLDSPEQLIREIALVLKPHGKLLLSTPNLLSLEGGFGTLYSWLSGRRYTAWDDSHKILFRSNQLLRLLKTNGFSPLRITGYHYDGGYLPLVRTSLKLSPSLTSTSRWPLNRLGFNLIVEAERRGSGALGPPSSSRRS